MSAPLDPTTVCLLQSLEDQRAHVLGALEGLDAAALRRPVLPTGWNCLGLVQHLSLDVERFWFPIVMAGGDSGDRFDDDRPSAWSLDPHTSPDDVLALYRAEIGRANAVIRSTPLEAPPQHWPSRWGDWRLPDLRAVLVHVITETACHAGHLDAGAARRPHVAGTRLATAGSAEVRAFQAVRAVLRTVMDRARAGSHGRVRAMVAPMPMSPHPHPK
jgi:hypothetical protein